MKKILAFAIALLPLTTMAQKVYIIKADNVPFKDGDRIFLYYKVNGVGHADSTLVRNKAFKFSGTIDGLGTGFICRNDNPLYAAFLYDSADIYIEPGTIYITTTDSLHNANISGTKINEDNTTLGSVLQPYLRRLRDTTGFYDALPSAKQDDINVIADVRARTNKINREMEPVRITFVKSHPNAYISLVTLSQMVNNADILQVAEAYDGLTTEAKATKLGKSVSALIRSAKSTSIGALAADFTLRDQKGQLVKLSSLRGKYVLVDFWASWCLPCRLENPNVKAVYQKYKAKGFTVLSVSIDDKDSKAAWLGAIKKDALPWTQVLDNFQPSKKVKDLYGVTKIPANVLVDPNGIIIAKDVKDKVLQNKLAELFANK